MQLEKKYQVILGPHVSEKSTRISENTNKQIVFKVLPSATKGEVKHAVESLFDVKVDKVRMLNMKAKKKRFAQRPGKRNAWKKAYVCLKEGFDIDFAESAN